MPTNTPISYVDPPVAEVACSLQFRSALPLKLTDLAILAEQFRDRYPTVEDHAPLPPIQVGGSGFTFQFGASTYQLPRLFFVDTTSTQLAQLQRDRFGVNWRRADVNMPYPRYLESVRPALIDAYERLERGLEALHIESPSIAAIEVTYVNPIEVSPQTPISQVLRPWSGELGAEYPDEPSGFNIQLTYGLPHLDGSMFVAVERAQRTSDGQTVVLMNLVAQANVQGSFSEVIESVDSARGAIVRAFTALTTEDMHKRWQREV